MRPTCARLLAICAFLLFTPTWIQIKSFWAYLGLEIFVLFRLRETFPEYRWALTPIWWLFLGVPTDFEFAMEVTRRRGLQGKTLGPLLSPRKPSSFEAMMKKVGSDSTPDPSEPSAEEVVASHFALYKKTPGNIVITTRSVQFHAIRGFRTFSSLVHKKKYELVEDSASVHSDLPGKLVDIGVEEISGVKKGSILGGGFTISLSGGTVHTFDGVSDPSSAFVNLLSVAPSLSRKA